MRTTKRHSKEVEGLDEVFCNKCGETLRNPGFPQDLDDLDHCFFGICEYTYEGTYFSSPLEDCTAYTFSLCESCLSELFKSFIIPVETNPYYGEVIPDPRRQQILNQISKITDINQLASYLVDEDEVARAYAKVKINQLSKLEEEK